jgi:hypothetical protein
LAAGMAAKLAMMPGSARLRAVAPANFLLRICLLSLV